MGAEVITLPNTEHSRSWREKNPDRNRENNARYYAENAEAIKDRVRKQNRERAKRIRLEVIGHYGGACACCGEASLEFLTIDHINGGGSAQRRELKKRGWAFYRWLQKQGYPEGYRVLCWNCNSARGAFGYCPHEVEANRKEAI